MGERACVRDAFCPVHPVWREVQEGMRAVLGRVTLKHPSGDLEDAGLHRFGVLAGLFEWVLMGVFQPAIQSFDG